MSFRDRLKYLVFRPADAASQTGQAELAPVPLEQIVKPPVALATQARVMGGAEIGVAVVAHESGDDMRAEVGLDTELPEGMAVLYRELDLGESGYAIAPARDAKSAAAAAIRRKHKR